MKYVQCEERACNTRRVISAVPRESVHYQERMCSNKSVKSAALGKGVQREEIKGLQ